MRILPESLQKYFGGRTHQPIRVEHSRLQHPRRRDEDEDARLAAAVLHFRAFVEYVGGLPEEAKLAILASGGDAWKAQQFVEKRQRVLAALPTMGDLLRGTGEIAPTLPPAVRDFMPRLRAKFDGEVEQLTPVALKAKPRPTHTFNGLCELWGKKADGTWRVKSPRSFTSTAEKLAACFPERDYRTLDYKDGIFFAKWLNKIGTKPSSQATHIDNARTMYAKAWYEMPDRLNPFDKVEPVAAYAAEKRAGFTPKQVRNLLKAVDAHKWGDNRIEQRHHAVRMILCVVAYTGARINEIAALSKADVVQEPTEYTDDDGKLVTGSVPCLVIRKYKEQKSKKPKRVPLHDDIAAEFMAYAKAAPQEAIFGCFPDQGENGRARWIISNFAEFLRQHAAEIGGIEIVDGKAYDRDGARYTQHCLRHAFISACKTARIPDDSRYAFVGHTEGDKRDVDTMSYDTPAGMHILHEDINRVRPLG